jgi:hypothetical protein
MNKDFNVLECLTKSQITSIVNELGKAKLTETGQGYETFKDCLISLAANKSAHDYTKKAKQSPAISLIEVVLSANRNYNLIVEPRVNCLRVKYPHLKSFKELHKLIQTKSEKEFYDFWDYKDIKKYNTLKSILNVISELRTQYPQAAEDDYKLMHTWAEKVNLTKIKEDPIGSILNVGIATVQHLRMTFGFNTVKPDLRVKQVLEKEFKLMSLSNINSIKAVEQIASIMKLSVIECDQIFVMYGSSYYNTTKSKNKSSKSEYKCL